MKKSKIIAIIIFVIAAAAVLYFAYGVVKKRYISPANNVAATSSETQNQTGNQTTNNPVSDQTGDNQTSSPSEVDNTAPTNGQPDVQSSDCDNNCAQYKDNADNLKYCQEVCGIRPATPKDSESQCENLTGIDRDSCWKDLAVSKKDFSICGKVSDAKLRKVCRNRVTEEVLN
jgi:type II secretory pathway pseudopilin PulG